MSSDVPQLPCLDMLLDKVPVLAVQAKGFKEERVLFRGPATFFHFFSSLRLKSLERLWLFEFEPVVSDLLTELLLESIDEVK